MQNRSRQLLELLREICSESGAKLESFCDDWILRLTKSDRVSYVFGYDFDVNSATARMLAKDKAATSVLLGHLGIPVVEHQLFYAPSMVDYVSHSGNWPAMLQYFEDRGRKIVCKPNEGTGGSDVWRVSSELELETAVGKIFQRNRTLCLSPMIERARELRFIVVDGVCEVAYEKIRPTVTGDGNSTLAQLVTADVKVRRSVDPFRASSPSELAEWSRVPDAGETVFVNWRHNLSAGAEVDLLSEHKSEFGAYAALAVSGSAALTLKAASVDIFVTEAGPMILELNAGIMMENLAKSSSQGRAVAKRVYQRIIELALY